MRIGVLTGGGDVPGLNAAIRAVARRAFEYGWEVYGIYDGWKGLRDGIIKPLERADVSGILHRGGTILGSSRTNLAKKPGDMEKALENAKKFGLDAVVAIGGDDTLGVCAQLTKRGLPAVGIPKTMDNDVVGTDYCIGFNTAVTTVAEALDKLHSTAEAHHRVIVVEVMGRYTGWVAVMGGLAGGADYILTPEKPSSIADVCEHIKRRWAMGKKFSIVVVAEAAKIAEVITDEAEAEKRKDEFGHIRLDLRGLGPTIATAIEERTGFETRFVVLGHLQRGGSPTVFDRVLATRMGVYAVNLIRQGKFGRMVALQGDKITDVPLEEIADKRKAVDPELIELAQLFY
ncbi:MAG: 6-phosphofructokinase [Chloroflexi bacterium]|nr:6-phosphofructokinase [Chloroflexota bacterium]